MVFYSNLKRAEDKESSLSEELEDCVKQQTDIENNQLGKLKEASDEMLQAYNDNLEKCKVCYIMYLHLHACIILLCACHSNYTRVSVS